MVRALDAAGNQSGQSNSATATVVPPDTENPTPPGNLTATGGDGHVDLSWNASTDNVGVTGYRVYRGGQQIAVLGATTSFTDNNRPPGTYSYTVRAEDAAGRLSDPSNAAAGTVPDTEKPTAPQNLSATNSGAGQVNLAWQASTDNVGVSGYRVYRGGQQIAVLGATTSFTDTGRSPGAYSYTVRAEDAAGLLSDPSNTADVRCPTPRTRPRQPTSARPLRARPGSTSPGRHPPTTSESRATGSTAGAPARERRGGHLLLRHDRHGRQHL